MLSEARVLLAIPPHPHVPLVRDDFFDGDQYIIAMDWVEGADLARLLHSRGRPGLGDVESTRWLAAACALVGRDLTTEEWEQYMGRLRSRSTCSGL